MNLVQDRENDFSKFSEVILTMNTDESQFLEYYHDDTREWLLIPKNFRTKYFIENINNLSFEEQRQFLSLVAEARACVGLPLWEASMSWQNDSVWPEETWEPKENMLAYHPDDAARIIQRCWKTHVEIRKSRALKEPYEGAETDLEVLKVIWDGFRASIHGMIADDI